MPSNNYTNSAYGLRPLVRLPFKPDVPPYTRIETVASDALNFAWPLRASLVMTNVLVKMLERKTFALPALTAPVRAAKMVGQHGNANMISVIRFGRKQGVRPLEVLQELCESALTEHERDSFLDDESVQVLGEVIMVSDLVTHDPMSAAAYVESVARLLFIRKRMEQTGLAIDAERICRLDYFWDKLNGGMAERLRETGKAGWLGFDGVPTIHSRNKRIVTPPTDTRAKIRADLIKQFPIQSDLDWTRLPRGKFLHPYETTLE